MLYVRELIGKAAPEIGISYGKIYNRPNHPSKGVGGFAARHTAKGGFSRHSEGRACDIYVNTSDLYLRLLGDALFKRFAANHRVLGILTSSVEDAKCGMPLYEHAPRGYRSGNE
jgi:hypothetical protein